ncbi:MAG: MBL fold metallo-hydrolase [Blastocatellia bacterium]|nr:MBL fold metallo-hydrolase [Blastocatellia bacterium]
MRVIFLGTGTSVGVPSVGCDCETCLSPDPRDKRLRTSVLIHHDGRHLLIDASTDFRQQALRVGLRTLDAILFTHAHADHCFGLDERKYSFTRPIMFRHGAIACFATETTWQGLSRVYSYVFEPAAYSAIPRIVPHRIEGRFNLFGLDIEPLTVIHGRLAVTAYRINDFAYVTDCNAIPDEACARLRGLDLLVIDSLRFRDHPTHMTVDRALRYIDELKPRRALLTQWKAQGLLQSHDIKHAETCTRLPAGVRVAYDGLEVDVG